MTVTDTPPTAALAVTIDATALKAAMAKLKPAICKTISAPSLRCVRVDMSGSDVMLTATDLDVTLSTVVTGDASADGSLLVPADVLTRSLARPGTSATETPASSSSRSTSTSSRSCVR
jgi:DNA polymerase III sliding clamp (beta) subunit (PCNA family)